jgi:hypothetical protein
VWGLRCHHGTAEVQPLHTNSTSALTATNIEDDMATRDAHPSSRPNGSPQHQDWSVNDRTWWIICVVALIACGLAQRVVPGGPDDLLHFAAGLPLATGVAMTLYWRLRLRVRWMRAVSLGLAVFASVLALG